MHKSYSNMMKVTPFFGTDINYNAFIVSTNKT